MKDCLMTLTIFVNTHMAVSRYQDTQLLKVEADLLYTVSGEDDDESLGLRRYLSNHNSLEGSRLGQWRNTEQVCVACMDVALCQNILAMNADELKRETRNTFHQFDAISGTTAGLCEALHDDVPSTPIDQTMAVADDSMIGQLGMIEWVDVLKGISLSEALPALSLALSPLSRMQDGLFMAGAASMDLSSNHKRLFAQDAINAFDVTRKEHRTHLIMKPWGSAEENALFFCIGLASEDGITSATDLNWNPEVRTTQGMKPHKTA
jgi:hypothetical protein